MNQDEPVQVVIRDKAYAIFHVDLDEFEVPTELWVIMAVDEEGVEEVAMVNGRQLTTTKFEKVDELKRLAMEAPEYDGRVLVVTRFTNPTN